MRLECLKNPGKRIFSVFLLVGIATTSMLLAGCDKPDKKQEAEIQGIVGKVFDYVDSFSRSIPQEFEKKRGACVIYYDPSLKISEGLMPLPQAGQGRFVRIGMSGLEAGYKDMDEGKNDVLYTEWYLRSLVGNAPTTPFIHILKLKKGLKEVWYFCDLKYNWTRKIFYDFNLPPVMDTIKMQKGAIPVDAQLPENFLRLSIRLNKTYVTNVK